MDPAPLRWALPLLVAGVVAIAFGPAVPNFFVSDDLDMLSGNASDLFSPASGFGRFMPVAASVHLATARLAQLDPVPPHLFQLGLHIACSLLVYAVARALSLSRAAATAGALLWALYPRHHQVVMWFGAISIGLSSACGLAALWCFASACRRRSRGAGWLAVALYTLALLSHESAVALPLLALLVAWKQSRLPAAGWPLRLPAWGWAASLVAVAHLGTLAWAYQVRAAQHPDSGYRFLGVGGDLLLASPRYAAWLLLPPQATDPWASGASGAWLGALAIALAALLAWRGGGWARFGLAWLVCAAAPAILFGIYGVTDRYYYLPTVGISLALASLAATGRWRIALVAGYAVLCVLTLHAVAAEWHAAGTRVRATMAYLHAWIEDEGAAPQAVLFVDVPFKRSISWPGSQVYVFSTGIVGAAHLATGRPELRVSYLFADEQPTLSAWLAMLPSAPPPAGLRLLALEPPPALDYSTRLAAALPTLSLLRWRGGSRLPVDVGSYSSPDRTPP